MYFCVFLLSSVVWTFPDSKHTLAQRWINDSDYVDMIGTKRTPNAPLGKTCVIRRECYPTNHPDIFLYLLIKQ